MEHFAKTLRNHRDFGVCKWMKKVYTWLILVCNALFLVYTWFDCRENRYSNAVNLSKNNVGITMPVICVALKCYISQNFWQKITMTLLCLHEVWPKFTPIKKKGLHQVYIKKFQKVCTEFTLGYHCWHCM